MKIAIFGRGKTGSRVFDVAGEKGYESTVFHTENTPTLEKLDGHDVIISFLPGAALASYLPLVKEAKLPVISGSTGYDFSQVKDLLWIQGHNFSLGMNIIHEMINVLQGARKILGAEMTSQIHEVHHTKKLDSPSGTALRWDEWSGLGSEITSERIGDVVGDHIMTVKTPTEEITLRHQALDRKIFAAGAIWMAEILPTLNLETNFYWFEDLVKQQLKDI